MTYHGSRNNYSFNIDNDYSYIDGSFDVETDTGLTDKDRWLLNFFKVNGDCYNDKKSDPPSPDTIFLKNRQFYISNSKVCEFRAAFVGYNSITPTSPTIAPSVISVSMPNAWTSSSPDVNNSFSIGGTVSIQPSDFIVEDNNSNNESNINHTNVKQVLPRTNGPNRKFKWGRKYPRYT